MNFIKKIILILVISTFISVSFNSTSAYADCSDRDRRAIVNPLIVLSLLTGVTYQSISETDKMIFLYNAMDNERIMAFIAVMTYLQSDSLFGAVMANVMAVYILTNNLSMAD
jgi:hypothetical protein